MGSVLEMRDGFGKERSNIAEDERSGSKQEQSFTEHLNRPEGPATGLDIQASDDPADPLNWSWGKKHRVLVPLISSALLCDWGLSWGFTMFEAQAKDWKMSVHGVSGSAGGAVCMQGAGGVLTVPLVQRYGRLPVLFWSQFLSCVFVIGGTFSPSFASFTVCRTLQGLVCVPPQVIGLSVINDMFFFHERARKINIWAFCFLMGPFIGPFFSGLLMEKINWRQAFGILAGLYAFSCGLVAVFGEETLFDRNIRQGPLTSGGVWGRIELLTGIAGVRATGRPTLWTVSKHLAAIAILPQLLGPGCTTPHVMWSVGLTVTITQYMKPAPYHFSSTAIAFLYLSPLIGGILGEAYGHFFNDWLQNRYMRKHNGTHEPENRLWGTWFPTILGSAALIVFGQVLQSHLHWVGIALSWAAYSFSGLAQTVAVSGHILDSFPHHAALASSWINFWRTFAAFSVVYFQARWVKHSGPSVVFNVESAICAAAFTGVIVTQKWGRRWRTRFPAPEPEN
ncbi:hypothetical protein AJ80_00792 [Polytolypa hystricis UAMH7299]|uniref:Major facilitator superfamily (MFS) profile domain-containing protein n=1 Tax=Polytolypa hystricis (strain UAMH7299) TaxID=1447883 RepID=A0A2B7Z2H9_POLH7|nr:hypothetical protein AJ80_00792 [Polytolypa hystricis UAMH7299]